jgi:hypothetical protein
MWELGQDSQEGVTVPACLHKWVSQVFKNEEDDREHSQQKGMETSGFLIGFVSLPSDTRFFVSL